MKYVIAALLAVLLCTGASRLDRLLLRNKEPALVMDSNRTPDDFIGCFNPKLYELLPSIQTVRDGDSTILVASTLGNPTVAVEVSPNGAGSRVTYRPRFNTVGYGKYKEAVESCR